MDMFKKVVTLDIVYNLISALHSDLCNSTERGDEITDISLEACRILLRLRNEIFNHGNSIIIQECEIKDIIDSFFGSDSAYYGIDGFAMAAVLTQFLREKQQHMLELIKKELVESFEQNMEVLSTRRDKFGMDEHAFCVQGKISAIQGLLDFIEKFEELTM